jgi:predicted RNase H-like HicB family nuclease
MADLVFEAAQEADGGYSAECLTENIFTQGDTWEELGKNVIDATAAFFFDQSPLPRNPILRPVPARMNVLFESIV